MILFSILFSLVSRGAVISEPLRIEAASARLAAETVKVDLTAKEQTILVFLSTQCPCSHSHLGELKKLAADHPEMQFIAVHSNADEGPEATVNYFDKAALPFPVLQDEANILADRFRAFKTPHAFVLNKKGELQYQGGVTSSRHASEADTMYLREVLDDLSHHKTPRRAEGRTLGCVINRGEKHVWKR